jgi:hypothetical protein
MNELIELKSANPIRIGVIADTHIPDRVNGFHPQLLGELMKQKVEAIFHCGDLSRRQILDELKAIAPVYAVRGNRDFFLAKELPKSLVIIVNGVRIFLTHGHMNPAIYWSDKVINIFQGYRLKRYVSRLIKADPDAKIYIFGHTHHPENSWVDGRLFFNPGGSSVSSPPECGLSYGVLQIGPKGEIENSINQLGGAVVKFKKWESGEFSQSEYS